MPHSVLRVAALLVLIASTAQAQELAGTFDQLRVLTKPGDTLTVTDTSGNRIRGKLSQLLTSSMVLDVSGALRQLQATDVDKIEKRGSDSLKNGALIGLGIGSGLGVAVLSAIAADDGISPWMAIGALTYGGIGAGIGVGVDALIEGQRVIYAGSRPQISKLSISPILTRDRKGVMLSLPLPRLTIPRRRATARDGPPPHLASVRRIQPLKPRTAEKHR